MRGIPVLLFQIRLCRLSLGVVGACLILFCDEFHRLMDAMLCMWHSGERSVAAVASLQMPDAPGVSSDLGRCVPGAHVHRPPSALVFSLHEIGSNRLPAGDVSSGGH